MSLVNFEITNMNSTSFHRSDRAVVSSENYQTRLTNFFSHTDVPISVTIGENVSNFSDNVFNIWIPTNFTATYNPLTPWIVAHRSFHEMSHFNDAFNEGDKLLFKIYEILKVNPNYYNNNGRALLLSLLLTSKVGRECKHISCPDIVSELFAQHLNGGIKLLRKENWQDKIDFSVSLKGQSYNVLNIVFGEDCQLDQYPYNNYSKIDYDINNEMIIQLEQFLTNYFNDFIQKKIEQNFAKNFQKNHFKNTHIYN